MLTNSNASNSVMVGDVLISNRKRYHYVCISMDGDKAIILWLNRISGEPYAFYQYKREIRASTADMYYDVIPSGQVNRSNYYTPKNGWPT